MATDHSTLAQRYIAAVTKSAGMGMRHLVVTASCALVLLWLEHPFAAAIGALLGVTYALLSAIHTLQLTSHAHLIELSAHIEEQTEVLRGIQLTVERDPFNDADGP